MPASNTAPAVRLSTLAIIGAILFVVINWWPAFTGQDVTDEPHVVAPELSKDEAKVRAEKFIQDKFGENDLDSFVTYTSDQHLSGYLQQNGLYDDYAEKYRKSQPIDYFRVESVNADRSEVYTSDIDLADGRVFAFSRAVPNPAFVKQIGNVKVDPNAIDALVKEMGFKPGDFKDVSAFEGGEGEFVLENAEAKVGESLLTLRIQTAGGDILSFRPEFRLPDAYIEWADGQDRSTAIMSLVSLLASLAFAIAAIVLVAMYRKQAAMSRGVVLTLLFAVIYCVNNINMYPAFRTAGDGYAAMFTVMFMNFIILLMAAGVYLSFVSGDAMWRKEGRDLWPKWREARFGQEVLSGMGRGYLVSLILLGTQALLFLVVDRSFGVWSTNDPAASPYNMLWPVVFPLMAWAAAISEESVYRLFGIIIFKKMFRNTFVAVLIPSMIWALGHTAYPIYPVYTRFFEVTILGLIFGYVFLKYGFLTALFAHAIMDTILMGFSLISLGSVGNALLGFGYFATPALIGWAVYLAHGFVRKKYAPST